jgi:enediyne biosynthesis protein E4
VAKSLGEAFVKPRVARGAAMADIDNDGDLDLAITTNGGPAVLLRNDGGTNASLRVRLEGVTSNRDGIGAVVRVGAGDDRQWQMVRTGSSYLSQSELVLTFGLGSRRETDEVEIRWPSGTIDRLGRVTAGQTITVRENSGIVDRRPYARPAS